MCFLLKILIFLKEFLRNGQFPCMLPVPNNWETDTCLRKGLTPHLLWKSLATLEISDQFFSKLAYWTCHHCKLDGEMH